MIFYSDFAVDLPPTFSDVVGWYRFNASQLFALDQNEAERFSTLLDLDVKQRTVT